MHDCGADALEKFETVTLHCDGVQERWIGNESLVEHGRIVRRAGSVCELSILKHGCEVSLLRINGFSVHFVATRITRRPIRHRYVEASMFHASARYYWPLGLMQAHKTDW